MTRFHVLIPAAGSGRRMESKTPKQYLPLANDVVIAQTLRVFLNATNIHSVNIVLSENDAYFKALSISQNLKLNIHYCGGETRATTVLNGLKAIANMVEADDWVLVHDAARPGLSAEALNRLITELQNDDVGGLLALPLADTLKRADNAQRVTATMSRGGLWQAQTPQMFRYATLKNALTQFAKKYNSAPTDEAEAIEALGLTPKLVIGELQNLKVTYPHDLAVIAALMKIEVKI